MLSVIICTYKRGKYIYNMQRIITVKLVIFRKNVTKGLLGY